MRKKQSHFVVCWLATFAFIANAAGASTGLVHCESNPGQVAIEAVCDHDHCFQTGTHSSLHEHVDDESSVCEDGESCSCEDTPIGFSISTEAMRSAVSIGTVPQPWPTAALIENGVVCSLRNRQPAVSERPVPITQALRAMRTVVLLI